MSMWVERRAGESILRDGVKDMRELALDPRVPGRENPFELLWDKTTIIDLDGGP